MITINNFNKQLVLTENLIECLEEASEAEQLQLDIKAEDLNNPLVHKFLQNPDISFPLKEKYLDNTVQYYINNHWGMTGVKLSKGLIALLEYLPANRDIPLQSSDLNNELSLKLLANPRIDTKLKRDFIEKSEGKIDFQNFTEIMRQLKAAKDSLEEQLILELSKKLRKGPRIVQAASRLIRSLKDRN